MSNVFQLPPIFMAGIAAYIVFYHLLLYFRLRTEQRESLSFAITCFLITIFDCVCAGLYSAANISEGAFWLRAQFVITLLIAISFVWFVFDYLKKPGRLAKWIFTPFFCFIAVFAILDQSGLILQMDQPAVKVITITPTIQVIYYEVESGPLKIVGELGVFVDMGYLLWISVQRYRTGRHAEALPLVWGLAGFFACVTSDILVVSGLYLWVYMTEYGFLFLAVVMTVRLSNVIVDSRGKYRQLFEDAVKISEMKANLLDFTTHELKTPLVPIIGWAEFLEKGLAKGKKVADLVGPEEVASIAKAARRLIKIIERFLDLGFLESKEFKLHKEACDVQDILQRAIESVSLQAQADNVAISLDARPCQLYCDPFRIEQVFTNILSNAIKYSAAHSSVHITMEVTTTNCTISFIDQGRGFAPEDIEKACRPYWKKSPTGKKGLRASHGLGLYLSKLIAEAHGGEICISSPGLGKGSTVSISLPLGSN